MYGVAILTLIASPCVATSLRPRQFDDATLRLLKTATEEEGRSDDDHAPRAQLAALQTDAKRQPDEEDEYGDAASHDRLADPSDYSVHQFIAGDDARGVQAMNDNGDTDGDDGAQAEVDKSEAEARDDDFDSEDTPEDSFLAIRAQTKKFQKKLDQDVEDQSMDEDDDFEYGDAASHDRWADPP